MRIAKIVTLLTLLWNTDLANGIPIQAAEPAFGRRPNIILVMTDDQGYFDLSCHGNPVLKTPHLDRLHSQSMRFTRFQVSPTCAPTRSALMSGRAPFYVGVTHTILERERMKLGVPTMPQMLRDAGYTTGIFGKWHLGDQDPYRPDRRGFDEVFIHGAGGIGQSYAGSCGDAPGNKYFDPAILHNNKFVKTKGFCTDIFFDQAMHWIEQVKGKQPFFAYIPTNAPHGPMIAPEAYRKPFVEQGVKGGSVGFYGMISNIDDNMGRLMAKLDEWQLADDTILIFMTDNGPSATTYNGNHKGKKGSVDEGGTRVPFFIRWPGVLQPGVDVDRIARHFDILPTFAEIAGARPKEADQLHGRSLVPLLKDPRTDWEDRYLFFHKGRWAKGGADKSMWTGFAVRSQRFRLVGTDSLYDMQADPGQKVNVIQQHPDVAEKMLAAYESWWKGARPHMVNEDAPLEGPNTFKAMYWKQFNIDPPPPKKKPPKQKSPQKKPLNQTTRKSDEPATPSASLPPTASSLQSPASSLQSDLCDSATDDQPNMIVIYMDDLGYGDIGCFGSTKNRTPVIDQMARDGMRFTDFYVTSGVCTPSRSSLMTGCYPRRVNMHIDENGKWVLFPVARKGLHPDEVTVAEVLKEQGYATACIGKWHLGDQPGFLPTDQGFDFYYGIPYSNDMHRKFAPLPLLRNATVIEAPVQQKSVTRRYTDEAIAFIERHAEQPFFLYLPHTAVHLPLFPGEAFVGKSQNGKYGDWIEEVDASTGEILKTLDRLSIAGKTLVIFTSDNGSNGRNGGSNAPLKGFKGDTDEGSMRVPCVMRWPDRIPAGTTCREVASTLDLLPTFAAISGGQIPQDRALDGHDIRDLMFAKQGATSPHEAFFYYHTTQLQAIRSGKWKLVLPHSEKLRGWSGKAKDTPLQLYDLHADIDESNNVASEHPQVVARLQALGQRARAQLGDGSRAGDGQRPAGWVAEAKPLLKMN